MVNQCKLTYFLVQNGHKFFPFFSKFIQCVLLFKKFSLSLSASLSKSISKEQRSDIILLHYLMNILMPTFVYHTCEHPKVTIAKSPSCLNFVGLVSINKALYLSNIELLIFLNNVTCKIQ